MTSRKKASKKSGKPNRGATVPAKTGDSDFESSPLPLPFQLASLAATLINLSGGKLSHPREAVELATNLWAASLEMIESLSQDCGRGIETLRLFQTYDRSKSEHRWQQWLLDTQPNYAEAVKIEVQSREFWRAKGLKFFKGLVWPAKFDAVMQRIIGGSEGDGKDCERFKLYTQAWLAFTEPTNTRRIEDEYNFRKPSISSVIHVREARRKSLEAKGESSKLWIFSGVSEEVANQRLTDALALLTQEWEIKKAAALAAGKNALERMARKMQSSRMDEDEAIRVLQIWSDSERARKEGERIAKVKLNLKQEKGKNKL